MTDRDESEDFSEPDVREVSATLVPGEGDIDGSLRPRSLREFIGQPRVREQLQLVIEGAKNRGGTPDHILLSGPPGLGKTSLAMVIAAELGSSSGRPTGPHSAFGPPCPRPDPPRNNHRCAAGQLLAADLRAGVGTSG